MHSLDWTCRALPRVLRYRFILINLVGLTPDNTHHKKSQRLKSIQPKNDVSMLCNQAANIDLLPRICFTIF